MENREAIRILKNEKFWETDARICEVFEIAINALEENQKYRILEQRLQSVYGEHEGLLEIIVNGLARYENAPNKAIRAVLLTDEDADRWEQLKAGRNKAIDEFTEKVCTEVADKSSKHVLDGGLSIDMIELDYVTEIIMDMPSSCEKCRLHSFFGKDCNVICNATGLTQNYEDAYKGKPDWCPLRELPQKKDTKYSPSRNPYITEGYNNCIDEILKGSEENG